MTKKLKVRVSALIMCAAMLVTSMVVFAASKTETVGLDTTTNGMAYIFLESDGYIASARTSGESLYNDILVTSITAYKENGSTDSYSHVSYAEVVGADYVSASSYHKWTSRTHTMTIYN